MVVNRHTIRNSDCGFSLFPIKRLKVILSNMDGSKFVKELKEKYSKNEIYVSCINVLCVKINLYHIQKKFSNVVSHYSYIISVIYIRCSSCFEPVQKYG